MPFSLFINIVTLCDIFESILTLTQEYLTQSPRYFTQLPENAITLAPYYILILSCFAAGVFLIRLAPPEALLSGDLLTDVSSLAESTCTW